MCRMQCYANESCLTPKFTPAYGTILFPGVNGVLKHIHLGWSKSCCISYQKACCICISRPQYQLYSYTNSTINIRKLYRTCYDSATAYDSSAASCRISSQISPMSLITLSSLLGDNINHWMNLYPILLPFTMLLDGCIIILFSFTWFNRIDLQLSSLSRVVSYMTL